jgi:hypothetical protein
MPDLPPDAPNILTIHLEITQYPMLARHIRHRMREELYRRGAVAPDRFEQEVREKAVLSQRREGLTDPLVEEAAPQWEERLRKMRNHLTEFYFAYNLPLDLFHQIIEEVLAQRGGRRDDVALSFNPELAPVDVLLKHAERIEALPTDQLARVRHHLEEIIVVLTKTMISDQLGFVGVAKAWFTVEDFKFIQSRLIGAGKIGGKAAGLLLAWKILQKAEPAVAEQVTLPESYFIGANVFYDFLSLNHLEYNQKYKSADQIRAEYPEIRAAYEQARFPEPIADRLRDVLREVGKTPLIVRSSSLLEDNFGASFAGKYASHFCPNQGTLKENLRDLMLAIRRTYASVSSPDALFYRLHMGLIDYDERMAILLQTVQGQTYRHYLFPTLAGVAFSYSPVVWSPRFRREDGFVRLVLGMGTRAVERVGEDYVRLINLSHPMLRPEIDPATIRRYSQRFLDLIDLEKNTFTTVPFEQVLDRDYPPLFWVASRDQGDAVLPMFSLGAASSRDRLVLTFDTLLQRSSFVSLMKGVLSTLSQQYRSPVDIEFAISLTLDASKPRLTFHLLQCRPQSSARSEASRPVPTNLPKSAQVFLASRMVPQGQVSQVEYIVYVDPSAYSQMADPVRRVQVARIIGRLNKALEEHPFILMGPGRWGSSNTLLGVPVSYADIYNARALVEVALPNAGVTPDPSYGTHFFQDLVEAHIFPLAVYPEEPGDFLNREFIEQAGNSLAALLPEDADYGDCVKVICVPQEREGCHLDIAMDGEQALAYLSDGSQMIVPEPPVAASQPLGDEPQNPFYGW